MSDSALSVFFKSLQQSGFAGDVEDSYGARIVAATDNSIYQTLPKAIVYPRELDDLNRIVKAVIANPDQGLSLVARGGGTGTNGQSLGSSIIVDTSRYLKTIISLDEKQRQVTVQPGVVLDQLNVYLRQFGLFYPIDISTSTRATLGGMVATDASGKGSRVYGKTADTIESMTVVLADATDYEVSHSIDSLKEHDQLAQQVHQQVVENKAEIDHMFPNMNRTLTGYNLQQVLGSDQRLRLPYLLAGSEGTLALTKSITLKVLPIPQHLALIAVFYDDFLHTLDHVGDLLSADPDAIEVLDDKILALAKNDSIWQDVKKAFGKSALNENIRGMSFIEITAEEPGQLEKKCQQLESIIEQTGENFGVIDQLHLTDAAQISSLWTLRKRSVGLLGALEGDRRALAFVEDTAVPQAKLPAFVRDFRSVLDKHQLDYGMFGHADVGCLHVRPTLDMRQLSDQKLMREVSDQVANLCRKYQGLMWGEHGRGYRGEYAELFFGKKLLPVLEQIKTLFDPNNIFNPGKMATPKKSKVSLIRIDEATFRGQYDVSIDPSLGAEYDSALRCNGNGACFSWQLNEAMCPSYKASGDKRLSPKGRASMLREWVRLRSLAEVNQPDHHEKKHQLEKLEEELFESLGACLSCKSCTYSCPIKVDIPELKSQFLQYYHSSRPRVTRDFVIAQQESVARIGRQIPRLSNAVMFNSLSKKLLKSVFGVVTPPTFSASLNKSLASRKAIMLDMNRLPNQARPNQVILLPDSFNASFESSVVLAAYDILSAFNFEVLVAPVFDNGKALHVKGQRERFAKVSQQMTAAMAQLAATKIPLISIEIVTRLMHKKEYVQILGQESEYEIFSLESWLLKQIERNQSSVPLLNATAITPRLFPHCMEQTADKKSYADWLQLFELLGLKLELEIAGCCGMAGLFGHEVENEALSKQIFESNWKCKIERSVQPVLASGFSCRSQIRRYQGKVKHPLEWLASLLKS